nr:MAG TPA: hypothetical protein [Caudoviricetes sp.]
MSAYYHYRSLSLYYLIDIITLIDVITMIFILC